MRRTAATRKRLTRYFIDELLCYVLGCKVRLAVEPANIHLIHLTRRFSSFTGPNISVSMETYPILALHFIANDGK
jgi:hypothetical protein